VVSIIRMLLHLCWSENLKGRDHLEDIGINEKIIADLSLGK